MFVPQQEAWVEYHLCCNVSDGDAGRRENGQIYCNIGARVKTFDSHLG